MSFFSSFDCTNFSSFTAALESEMGKKLVPVVGTFRAQCITADQ